jgi:hypothetical protein
LPLPEIEPQSFSHYTDWATTVMCEK